LTGQPPLATKIYFAVISFPSIEIVEALRHCKAISLIGVAIANHLFSFVLGKIKKSSGVARLKEVVKEQPLLDAEFPNLPAFCPRQRRAIGVERVRKRSVGATLIEQGGRCVVIHLNCGETVQMVCLPKNCIPRLVEYRAELGIVFHYR